MGSTNFAHWFQWSLVLEVDSTNILGQLGEMKGSRKVALKVVYWSVLFNHRSFQTSCLGFLGVLEMSLKRMGEFPLSPRGVSLWEGSPFKSSLKEN